MAETPGSSERRKLLASHTQSCACGNVMVKRFETESQNFGRIAGQLPAGEVTLAKTWTALTGRVSDKTHLAAAPQQRSSIVSNSSDSQSLQAILPKMTIRSTQAPSRIASFINEFPAKGKDTTVGKLPQEGPDLASPISQPQSIHPRLLPPTEFASEAFPVRPETKKVSGVTARRPHEFSLEHAVSVKTGFPGTPWVSIQLRKPMQHSSTTSFPSSCFILGRVASENPSDKKPGSAIACCITITRWKPVLQVQFPPPLPKPTGSKQALNLTAKAASAGISFIVEHLQQLSARGQSLVLQVSQSPSPSKHIPLDVEKQMYPVSKHADHNQLIAAVEALLQGGNSDASSPVHELRDVLNQRLSSLKDAGLRTWQSRETLASSIIPAARMWGHQFFLTIHQDISEHFEGVTRSAGLPTEVQAILQAPHVVAELFPIVLRRILSKFSVHFPAIERLTAPAPEPPPTVRSCSITYRTKNGAVMTKEESMPLSAWPSFILPVQGGWLSSTYGWRGGRFHQGIDIAVEVNTDIKAAADGVVTYVGWRGGYGKVVHLDHGDGCTTLYAHCNKFLVKKGQTIQKMQRIALSGNTGKSTGPHLHFEIQRNGGTVDPMEFLPITRRSRFVLA